MRIFPAIQGSLGSWRYYSTKMTAADLALQVKFASEVWESKALDHWIQRTLNHSRAKNDISGYLAKHNDRFFNSIVVAAIEGNPKFFPVEITDDPRFQLINTDQMNNAFGILRFDGTEKYYALDGQHRLRAIRALIDKETEFTAPNDFDKEEFSVIIVVQKAGENREDFMRKYRRLFSHLNRHAKPMDKATTLIMEEDDAFAICTRRLIQEHSFFSWIEGETTRVRCEGSENMPINDPYFTNIITLYEMTITLLSTPERRNSDTWGDRGKKYKSLRPSDDELEKLYEELVMYWDAILEEFPIFKKEPRVMRTNLAEDNEVDGQVMTNNLLFRPIGQSLLAELIRERINKTLPNPSVFTKEDLKKSLKGLGNVEWRLFCAPWRNLLFVYQEDDKWKMRNEERRIAENIGLRIVRWIVGVDDYGTEESLIESLKKPWLNALEHVSDQEADDLWIEIESQAQQFRG